MDTQGARRQRQQEQQFFRSGGERPTNSLFLHPLTLPLSQPEPQRGANLVMLKRETWLRWKGCAQRARGAKRGGVCHSFARQSKRNFTG
jgi:hypothetical protein